MFFLVGYDLISLAPSGSTWNLNLGKFILLYVVFLFFSTNVALIQCLDGLTSVSDVFKGIICCFFSGMTDVELEMSRKLGDEILSRSQSTLLDFATRTDGVYRLSVPL